MSSKSIRDSYDAAVNSASQVNASTTSTIVDVKNAVAALTAAQTSLNGRKVKVGSLTSLTSDEASQIVKLAAAVNGVDESTVKFTNNNASLTITDANGFQTVLNISDYAGI